MELRDIKSPQDIKSMSIDELAALAKQIRIFLVQNIAKTGGHLSSNLGVVEVSIALHYVFDSPKDKLIFDVGHQSYVHKILTGRAKEFHTLRQFKGLAGFQKRIESKHDVWEAGHSSTSLSAALGMAIARDLNHETYQIIPIIGDGALSGGMAMEALNQIGSEQANMVIIFNDNNMSITKNVGAMDDAFTRLRTSKPYNELKEDLKHSLSNSKFGKSLLQTMINFKNTVKENVVDTSIFGNFNMDYIGPVDGHNLKTLIKVLQLCKTHKGPIVIHCITQKGKGYRYAQDDCEGKWHGVSMFNPITGEMLNKQPIGFLSWSEVFSETLCDLASKNENICAITPAMKAGSKLCNFFERYPKRAFDCGIAEEHAMTFAASLTESGKRGFISIYSSFIQRAYDQVLHDVARMNIPLVIGIDRCSLVGEDGETHHGVFDISMFRPIPNLIIAQPKDAFEAQNLLYTAFEQNNHPFIIRYPRGSVSYQLHKQYKPIKIGTWEAFLSDTAYQHIVITYGSDVDEILSSAKKQKLPLKVINARFFKPLDEAMLTQLLTERAKIFVYESDMLCGGLSSAILEFANDHHCQTNITRIGIHDHFVEHGSNAQLYNEEKINIDLLFKYIKADQKEHKCV